jgi:hypothetical protein
VTFWLPQSLRGLMDFKSALHTALEIVDAEVNNAQIRRQSDRGTK